MRVKKKREAKTDMSETAQKRNRQLDEPVSIVMPVYNEFEALETVLAEFAEVLFRYLPEGSEFLIEEGGSDDGTRELLKEFQQRWPFLDVVYNDKREGAWAALQKLILRAKCPWVFVVDSDGQCVAGEFWRLVPYMKDYDFILGAKLVRYDPVYRRFGSIVFNAFMAKMFGVHHTDVNFSFRLARREPFQECARRYQRIFPNLFNAETTIWAHVLGNRIKEVPVHFRPRVYGISRCFPGRSWFGECLRSFLCLRRMKKDVIRQLKEEGRTDHPLLK
jgi:glycosyltransferase involved in cell wall biosynthesis